MPNLPNIFRQTTVPTVASSRSRSFTPGASDPVPDPATGDLWIDMSQTPPVLKVLDGALSGVTIATPPGTPTGTLQFNNAGAFGGVTGSVVGGTGAVTLSPASGIIPLTLTPIGNTNTGLSIFNATGATVGLSIQRFSGTGDAMRIVNSAGTTEATFNADNTLGPLLKLTTLASEDKQVLQLRRPNAAAASDLFQVYDSGDATVVFLVNPSSPTTGTVRIAPTVTNGVGLVINTTGNTTAQQLVVQNGGSSIFETTSNVIDLIGGTRNGVKISGTTSTQISTASSVFDILLQTAPTIGLRIVKASVYGTDDTFLQNVSATTGWSVYGNSIAGTNLGTILETFGALPVSIRPNRIETGQFPSGGGLVLFQAAPTVAAGAVGYGSTTATTANTGANGAPPAQVAGYLIVNIAGTARKIPFYVT